MRLPRRTIGATIVALFLAGGVAVALAHERREAEPEAATRPAPSAWRGLVGTPRQSVALGQRVIVLLDAPSLADRVREAGGAATDAQQRRWTASILAGQQQTLSELAAKGVSARPDLRFTRVVNGFSAVADPRAVVLLERAPAVAGVYPVRAAFPVSIAVDSTDGAASLLPSGLAAYPGRGVTVALLDTAVDPATPFLHGRVLPGFDIVAGGAAARYDQRPGGARLETHGTETAGIVVGRGGPGRPSGIAPDATVLPIRVAGWQRDVAGRWSVHARTDQVIAGLERAVDPNRDGAAHDAARIALVPLSEPFAAFADSPLARAAAGATELDSLVVAAAGNDGPGGPVFGKIGGPGGAPAALTVGAADLRATTARVRVSARVGLRVVLRRRLALLTTTAPREGAQLELVSARSSSPRPVFDEQGLNTLAGRAVVVPAGRSPRSVVQWAERAGAAVVLIAGDEIPAGVLGTTASGSVSVLSAPLALDAAVREAEADGRKAWLSIGPVDGGASPTRGRPASFSSWGLSFGGQRKPDVVVPGVALVTALPGAEPDGRSRLVSVSGSSIAAAVAAGLAARLAQARPSLDAAALRSALVGTARPFGPEEALAGGAGLVDAGRAASAEVVASPSTLAFGRGTGDGWQGRRTISLRNVSTRPITVYLSARVPRGAGVTIDLAPRKARIEAGGTVRVRARARVDRARGASALTGSLRVTPRGSRAFGIPWALILEPVSDDLIGEAQLAERRFRPADDTPAVLAVRIGSVERRDGRDAIEPALRFDVILRDGDGATIGLLARLRNVLPGRYAFGLTGRDPVGRRLAPGDYSLRLVAWPAAGGAPVTRIVRFGIR